MSGLKEKLQLEMRKQLLEYGSNPISYRDYAELLFLCMKRVEYMNMEQSRTQYMLTENSIQVKMHSSSTRKKDMSGDMKFREFVYMYEEKIIIKSDHLGVNRLEQIYSIIGDMNIDKYVKSLKVEIDREDFGLHVLRHTRATEVYYETKDPLVVRTLLRHRYLSSTFTYLHIIPGCTDIVADAKEEYIGNVLEPIIKYGNDNRIKTSIIDDL